MSYLSLFFAWLHKHRRSLLLGTLFFLLSLTVFYLYRLPLAAVGYALLLCLAFSLPVFLVDFFHFIKTHRSLLQIARQIPFMDCGLPPADHLLEEDLHEIFLALQQSRNEIQYAFRREKQDMDDYYTLWAHQIKTPISAMHLLLQADEQPDPDQIAAQLFSIEQYVEMVLTYLRLGSDSTDFVFCRYELDDIIRQAVRKYAPAFIQKKISLDFQETHLFVITDEKWLLFVLEQLLSNALKYTSRGVISIRKEVQDSRPGLLIRDTGIGIAPEDLPRIFEKGFTGYNGRKDKKSTGIGLYLCRKILARLSQEIRITSQPQKGTCVWISMDQPKEITE